jgi:hypothetical protein
VIQWVFLEICIVELVDRLADIRRTIGILREEDGKLREQLLRGDASLVGARHVARISHRVSIKPIDQDRDEQ